MEKCGRHHFIQVIKLTSIVIGHIEIRYLWTGWSRKKTRSLLECSCQKGRSPQTWTCALMESMETQVWWQRHFCRGGPGAECEDKVSINFWGGTWCGASEPKEDVEGQPEVECWSPSGLRRLSTLGAWPTEERQAWMGRRASVFRSSLAQGVKTQSVYLGRSPGVGCWTQLRGAKITPGISYSTCGKWKTKRKFWKKPEQGEKSP